MRLLPIILLMLPIRLLAQAPTTYTAKGHSHNDYAGLQPFTNAYSHGFGSIEADVFLVRDTLWVGHVPGDVEQRRSLEDLYLRPLADHVQANKGHAYPDHKQKLQLMIDIKTEAIPTLEALIREIGRHPELTRSTGLTWTISGNRPPDSTYDRYPDLIRFDGDITRPYADAPLRRIPMMSADFIRLVDWHGKAPLDPSNQEKLHSLIEQAHRQGKKVRFWNAPDDPPSWAILLSLGVDYINTDKVAEFAGYR